MVVKTASQWLPTALLLCLPVCTGHRQAALLSLEALGVVPCEVLPACPLHPTLSVPLVLSAPLSHSAQGSPCATSGECTPWASASLAL